MVELTTLNKWSVHPCLQGQMHYNLGRLVDDFPFTFFLLFEIKISFSLCVKLVKCCRIYYWLLKIRYLNN